MVSLLSYDFSLIFKKQDLNLNLIYTGWFTLQSYAGPLLEKNLYNLRGSSNDLDSRIVGYFFTDRFDIQRAAFVTKQNKSQEHGLYFELQSLQGKRSIFCGDVFNVHVKGSTDVLGHELEHHCQVELSLFEPGFLF